MHSIVSCSILIFIIVEINVSYSKRRAVSRIGPCIMAGTVPIRTILIMCAKQYIGAYSFRTAMKKTCRSGSRINLILQYC